MSKHNKLIFLIVFAAFLIIAVSLTISFLTQPSYDPDEFKDGEPIDIIEPEEAP